MNVLGHVTESQPLAFGSEVKVIVVHVGSGTVDLRGSDRTDVTGERTVEHGWQTPSVSERVEGDTLQVDGQCAFSAFLFCKVSYSLDVPKDVRVELQSGAGSVSVSGLDGAVSAHSGAGSVSATDCHGELDLEGGAGSIRGVQLRSPRVITKSGAGSVRLQFAVAPTQVDASSGAGSVDIEVPRDGVTYQITGSNGSGSRHVDVATASSADHTMHLQSGAGSTAVHYP